MLVITDAEARRFTDSLTEREYSPATISKYAHDLRLLMDYAPDGISDKAALVGFRAYLTERGYAPASVNSILGAVNVFFELLGLDWRLKYLPIQRKLYLDADKELSQREYERMVRTAEKSDKPSVLKLRRSANYSCPRKSKKREVTQKYVDFRAEFCYTKIAILCIYHILHNML